LTLHGMHFQVRRIIFAPYPPYPTYPRYISFVFFLTSDGNNGMSCVGERYPVE
jgi:hypothetical protein